MVSYDMYPKQVWHFLHLVGGGILWHVAKTGLTFLTLGGWSYHRMTCHQNRFDISHIWWVIVSSYDMSPKQVWHFLHLVGGDILWRVAKTGLTFLTFGGWWYCMACSQNRFDISYTLVGDRILWHVAKTGLTFLTFSRWWYCMTCRLTGLTLLTFVRWWHWKLIAELALRTTWL